MLIAGLAIVIASFGLIISLTSHYLQMHANIIFCSDLHASYWVLFFHNSFKIGLVFRLDENGQTH